MIRRPPRSTQSRSSAASDVYKRQVVDLGRAPRRPGVGVHHRKPRCLGGQQADAVGLDVVGVAVAAEGVVGHHNARPQRTDLRHQPAHGVVEVGLPERTRVGVALRAHHPGVAVAQEAWAILQTELGQGRDQLGAADLDEPWANLVGVHALPDDLTQRPVGAGHHGGGQALLRGARQHAAGGDGLVVGVRVHAQQPATVHSVSSPLSPARPLSARTASVVAARSDEFRSAGGSVQVGMGGAHCLPAHATTPRPPKETTMFRDTKAFSGFSVDDLARARAFYADTLGLQVSEMEATEGMEDMGGLMTLHLAGDCDVVVYEKADHTPASFTILNFPVDDIDAAVDELVRRGVSMERYDGFDQDEKGVARGIGPSIAWFTDPAGNVLSVLEIGQ